MWANIPWVRIVGSGLLLTFSFSFAGQATASGNQMGGAFGSVICLVFACILLGTAFVKQGSRPLTGIIDLIYFGGNPVDEPPPINLALPRAYRAERCYQKCIEECERQLQWHSLTPELWAELMLAHRQGGDTIEGSEAKARTRALECLGYTKTPDRFDKLVKERDNLPPLPLHLPSQFDR